MSDLQTMTRAMIVADIIKVTMMRVVISKST